MWDAFPGLPGLSGPWGVSSAEDMANAVLFFCSPMAAMVTGQNIAVDGGQSESINY